MSHDGTRRTRSGRDACRISRRRMLAGSAGLLAAGMLGGAVPRPRPMCDQASAFALNYVLSSCMYGTLSLEQVVAACSATGAGSIDIWTRPHADHLQQLEQMGEDRFKNLLDAQGIELGLVSRYDRTPFELDEAFALTARLGGRMVVTHANGVSETDQPIRNQVRDLVQRLAEPAATAHRAGLTLAIENHSSTLLRSEQAIRHFAELADVPGLGLALAPYHLPQDPQRLGRLIRDVGPRLVHFYAWQHGHGSTGNLSDAEQRHQLPGVGPMDFQPLINALAEIDYAHGTSVFMHPIPRGVPVAPTAQQTTALINTSREYLDACAAAVDA